MGRSMLALTVCLRSSFLAALVLVSLSGSGWAQDVAASRPPDLKRDYDAAQQLQQAGNLSAAAAQYRVFVSEALGELASGYAQAGNAARADALFDEALAVAPDSAVLRLHAAQAALAEGNDSRAQSLAAGALTAFAKEVKAAQAGHGAKPAESQVALAYQIQGRALFKQNQDKAARALLEKAVDLDPNFDNGYALAVVCLDMEDGACATQLFREMEASFGNTAGLHMEFGLAYGNSDFAGKAISEFKKAIALDNRLPEAHYALAAAYLASGQSNALADAVAELKQQLAITPNDALSCAALGHLYVSERRYADAAPYLKHAIALDPSSPDGYLYLGQMQYDTNHPAEAEAALRKAIALTTNPARNHYQIEKAHYLLGRLLARAGKQQEAAAQMKIVQAMMARTLTRARNRMIGAPDEDGHTPAGMASGSVTLAMPKNAKEAAAHSRHAQAVADFEKQLAPVLADSYNNLGAIAAGGGHYGSAFEDFKRAGQWDPQMPGVDLNLGHAAFMSSHFDVAATALEHYLKAHPQDGGIRVPLALSLYHTGKYAEVVTTLAPEIATAGRVPQVEFVYADSLVRTGKRDAGVPLLEALEKEHPEITDVHAALARAYASEGRAAKAARERRLAGQSAPKP